MRSLLTALEGVQAVSRDKDFYNLHPELGALFFKLVYFSSELGGVECMCVIVASQDSCHGTRIYKSFSTASTGFLW